MLRIILTAGIMSIAFSVQAAPKAKNTATTDNALNTCNTLVDKAVKKDFKAVSEMSLQPKMVKAEKLSEKDFNKMHEKHMGELKDLKCLREMVADDRAVVEAESEGGKRLIPFVQTSTGWKFDSGAYMALYDYGKKRTKK